MQSDSHRHRISRPPSTAITTSSSTHVPSFPSSPFNHRLPATTLSYNTDTNLRSNHSAVSESDFRHETYNTSVQVNYNRGHDAPAASHHGHAAGSDSYAHLNGHSN